jgi:hypothetical protein
VLAGLATLTRCVRGLGVDTLRPVALPLLAAMLLAGVAVFAELCAPVQAFRGVRCSGEALGICAPLSVLDSIADCMNA